MQELEDDWAKALEPIVDWSALGCDKTATDSTVWLGTGGSHTPLHYDTYGVNLVRGTTVVGLVDLDSSPNSLDASNLFSVVS